MLVIREREEIPMRTTISKRSRNLSIEWTNRPVTVWNPSGTKSWLGFKLPETSRERYGLAGCEREYSEARKLNSGNDWASALYVDGKCILTYDGQEGFPMGMGTLLSWLRDGITFEVTTEEEAR
jgi:hypothetical protein